MKTVTVTVEGGVVQHIDIPEGVRVVVKDYDVEGCDEAELEEDENGDTYFEAIWEHE
jgi:hypothetical protein